MLTRGGRAMPNGTPRVLIQPLRELCRCAATMRTVRRGRPGTGFAQIVAGRLRTSSRVMRQLVRHGSIMRSAVDTDSLLAG